MGIVLKEPGVYVPEKILTNQDLEKLVETSNEWIIGRTGIRERRIAFGEGVVDMAKKAVDNLKELTGDSLDVDEIRFATNYHGMGEVPCYARDIATHLEISNVSMQDVIAGCSGYVGAIRDSYNAIISGEIDSALVFGGETLSQMTNYGDRNTCVLFGDGVGVSLLRREDNEEGIISNFVGGIPDLGGEDFEKGFLYDEIGPKKELRFSEEEGFYTIEGNGRYLVMNGKQVFTFATKAIQHAVHKVLEDTSYDLSDVNVLIPHGANQRIVDNAQRGLKKNRFKGVVYTNLERFGNTSTATVPIATHEAIEKEIIKNGSLVLNVSFGAGLNFSANLYRAVI